MVSDHSYSVSVVCHFKLIFLKFFGFSDVTKLKKEDPQEIKIERIREQKWIKMINNWNSVSSEKLKKRVYKGIPNSLRGTVWAKLLHVDQLTDDQKNKYKVIIYLIIIYYAVYCYIYIFILVV